MVRRAERCGVLTLCLAVLGGATGCGKNPETRFYVLSALPAGQGAPGGAADRMSLVGLHPVSLPEQLDRPQIVSRVGANQLQVAEFDQWAAPLRDSFTRVLAEDLEILIPADRVALFPWAVAPPVDYEVAVEVVRFEAALGGEFALVAHWTIARRGGREAVVTGRSSHREPAGESYATMASAGSRLIATLGRDIATALRAKSR